MLIQIYIDDATHNRMAKIAVERHSSIEQLAENAVSEAALNEFRHRLDDPAKRIS